MEVVPSRSTSRTVIWTVVGSSRSMLLGETSSSYSCGELEPIVRLIEADAEAPRESLTSRSTRTGPGGKLALWTILSLSRVPSLRTHW